MLTGLNKSIKSYASMAHNDKWIFILSIIRRHVERGWGLCKYTEKALI